MAAKASSTRAAPGAPRAPRRLRRELIGAVALKLALLLALKAAFFPHRLSADEAAAGVTAHLTGSTAAGPSAAPAPPAQPPRPIAPQEQP